MKKRPLSLCLACFLLLSFTLPLALSDHDCCGSCCAICVAIDSCRMLLFLLFSGMVAISLALYAAARAFIRAMATEVPVYTPVFLRVKLSD